MRICVTSKVAEGFGRRIRSLSPDIEIIAMDEDGSVTPDVDAVEAFFLSEDVFGHRDMFRRAMQFTERPEFKWFHASSAGIDYWVFDQIIERGHTLTHSPGLHAPPIAEWVVGYMLHHVKRMRAHADSQTKHAWLRTGSDELGGKTLGIVGYGGIGAEAARLLQPFGVRVIATKRTPVEAPHLDELFPPDRLHDLLAQSDFVLLALPLTDESRALIGAPELGAMKPEAVLINVARGAIIDEPALIDALQSGTIAAAVLDVAAKEPLPDDSPLWDLPNCVITPHDSGSSPRSFERTTEHFLKNLARYVKGQPLHDIATTTGLSAAD